jgi:hypothetical protein
MKVVDPADVFVTDLPSDLDLVVEALNGPFVSPELGADELERDLLVELCIVNSVDLAHAAGPELLDDFIAAGE